MLFLSKGCTGRAARKTSLQDKRYQKCRKNERSAQSPWALCGIHLGRADALSPTILEYTETNGRLCFYAVISRLAFGSCCGTCVLKPLVSSNGASSCAQKTVCPYSFQAFLLAKRCVSFSCVVNIFLCPCGTVSGVKVEKSI